YAKENQQRAAVARDFKSCRWSPGPERCRTSFRSRLPPLDPSSHAPTQRCGVFLRNATRRSRPYSRRAEVLSRQENGAPPAKPAEGHSTFLALRILGTAISGHASCSDNSREHSGSAAAQRIR